MRPTAFVVKVSLVGREQGTDHVILAVEDTFYTSGAKNSNVLSARALSAALSRYKRIITGAAK